MMRLHILGDLHLEFGPVEVPATDADIVVLAGDVDVGLKGPQWIKDQFGNRPVIYVLGNHEFYLHALPELTETMKRETAGANIYVLENDAVELGGVTFLGCTLWTSFLAGPDPDAAMQTAEALINDYRRIRNSVENRVLRARDTVKLHRESMHWLKEELRRHDPARTVVVTHHAPSTRSEAPIYLNGPLSPSFVSDLDAFVEHSGVPLWVHGHTHYNVDYRIGSTRVLTNQRGYPSQPCGGFDPSLIVEI